MQDTQSDTIKQKTNTTIKIDALIKVYTLEPLDLTIRRFGASDDLRTLTRFD